MMPKAQRGGEEGRWLSAILRCPLSLRDGLFQANIHFDIVLLRSLHDPDTKWFSRVPVAGQWMETGQF
jgi:hypothetical protein